MKIEEIEVVEKEWKKARILEEGVENLKCKGLSKLSACDLKKLVICKMDVEQ